MFTTLYCLSFWTMFSRHAFGLKSGHPTVKISSLNLVILSLDILLLIGSLIDCRFFALFPCNLSHDRFDYRCPSDNLLSLRPWCCSKTPPKPAHDPLGSWLPWRHSWLQPRVRPILTVLSPRAPRFRCWYWLGSPFRSRLFTKPFPRSQNEWSYSSLSRHYTRPWSKTQRSLRKVISLSQYLESSLGFSWVL